VGAGGVSFGIAIFKGLLPDDVDDFQEKLLTVALEIACCNGLCPAIGEVAIVDLLPSKVVLLGADQWLCVILYVLL